MEFKTTKKGTYLKIDPADDDFGMMLNWAVRYSIGRMTYAPGVTMEFIWPLIPYLSDKTLWCFDRDIEDHQKHGKSFGMDFDEKAWMRFWKAVKDEIQRRDEVSGKRDAQC